MNPIKECFVELSSFFFTHWALNFLLSIMNSLTIYEKDLIIHHYHPIGKHTYEIGPRYKSSNPGLAWRGPWAEHKNI